jgi:NLI interacting factor-like phosphatase
MLFFLHQYQNDCLLFVWAQSECKTVYNKENREDPIFVKDLEKVWKKYPLWNLNNTLLVDDSPEKCLMWQANAIHPPPLNGLKKPITGKMRDEINVTQQQRFFEHLVIHWTNNSLVHDWDSESGDAVISNGIINQFDFLRRNGVGHMGYSA